jgi:hypothetical protein
MKYFEACKENPSIAGSKLSYRDCESSSTIHRRNTVLLDRWELMKIWRLGAYKWCWANLETWCLLMVLSNNRRLGAYKWCWGNLETWCLQMVLSKLGDLVPTNGAEQDEPINCFYDEINDCRGIYCMAMAVSACTCLRLLCECENVSRLWVLARVCDSYVSARTCLGSYIRSVIERVCGSYVGARACLGCDAGKARLERKFHKWNYRALQGKSKPYGWLAKVYIFGCEWPSELKQFRIANPRSDRVLWEIRSEMDSNIYRCCQAHRSVYAGTGSVYANWLIRIVSMQLFDTTLLIRIHWTDQNGCEEINSASDQWSWGGYIETQSRYQWGWDRAIKTQSRYSGNQDPVEVLGQV